MYRYQLLIEYVGTNFIGWQIQSNGKTIQKLIQTKLSKLLKEKISLVGSGRTDAGVHAIEQSAHFDCKKAIQNLGKFLKSVNHFVNDVSVSIIDIKKKKLNFHARFSAKQRIYKYIIFNRLSKPSIEKERGWHIIKELDIPLMKKGAKKLIGTKNFSTFRSSSCNAKSPIRTMTSIKIKSIKGRVEIRFQSQSFLQQQIRSMVGCLKYVGIEKWDLQKFKDVMNSKERINCAPPAPAEGLYLKKIGY